MILLLGSVTNSFRICTMTHEREHSRVTMLLLNEITYCILTFFLFQTVSLIYSQTIWNQLPGHLGSKSNQAAEKQWKSGYQFRVHGKCTSATMHPSHTCFLPYIRCIYWYMYVHEHSTCLYMHMHLGHYVSLSLRYALY